MVKHGMVSPDLGKHNLEPFYLFRHSERFIQFFHDLKMIFLFVYYFIFILVFYHLRANVLVIVAKTCAVFSKRAGAAWKASQPILAPMRAIPDENGREKKVTKWFFKKITTYDIIHEHPLIRSSFL